MLPPFSPGALSVPVCPPEPAGDVSLPAGSVAAGPSEPPDDGWVTTVFSVTVTGITLEYAQPPSFVIT